MRAWLATVIVLLATGQALGVGEEFEVAKEEPQTEYTRRWNWAHPRDPYYSTTRHDVDTEPRLDESRLPDQTPPNLYMGSATARFTGLLPGRYEVWVFYRMSTNRSRWVPWEIATDGTGHNTMSGHTDQYADVECCGEWYLVPETREDPLDVTSSLTLVWSRTTGDYPEYDGRSIAYGGARVIRVEDPPSADADADAPDEASAESDADLPDETSAESDARADGDASADTPGDVGADRTADGAPACLAASCNAECLGLGAAGGECRDELCLCFPAGSADGEGCGCVTPGAPAPATGPLGLGALVLGLLVRRRKAGRRCSADSPETRAARRLRSARSARKIRTASCPVASRCGPSESGKATTRVVVS